MYVCMYVCMYMPIRVNTFSLRYRSSLPFSNTAKNLKKRPPSSMDWRFHSGAFNFNLVCCSFRTQALLHMNVVMGCGMRP